MLPVILVIICMDSSRPPEANSGPPNRRWPNNLKHKEFERWLVERDAGGVERLYLEPLLCHDCHDWSVNRVFTFAPKVEKVDVSDTKFISGQTNTEFISGQTYSMTDVSPNHLNRREVAQKWHEWQPVRPESPGDFKMGLKRKEDETRSGGLHGEEMVLKWDSRYPIRHWSQECFAIESHLVALRLELNEIETIAECEALPTLVSTICFVPKRDSGYPICHWGLGCSAISNLSLAIIFLNPIETRAELDARATLDRIICFTTLLFYLFIAAEGVKKLRFKYPFGKASVLISWQCGDMERYPGPSPPAISDIARDFCKKMISLLVIRYWHRKEGRKVAQADYKKKPDGWAKDVWYGDPSTCTNNARNSMLKGLCNIQEIAPPKLWLELVEKYERLLEKQCSKVDRAHLSQELQSWLHQRRDEETVDYLFDRLHVSKVSNEERNYILGLMRERLKPYIPELSTISQSRKLEEDKVISQDQSISRHGSDTELSVDGRDPSDTNTASMNLQKGQTFNSSEGNKHKKSATQSSYCTAIAMPCSHEKGTSDSETTVPAEPPHDISDCLKDPPGGNSTYFVKYPTAEGHDAGSDNQDHKRKFAQEAALAITPSRSKRQKSSAEPEMLHSSQINSASNDSLDSLLDDLMNNYPEMYNKFLEDDCVSEFAGDNVQKTFLEEA